jgi:hypothetical protein
MSSKIEENIKAALQVAFTVKHTSSSSKTARNLAQAALAFANEGVTISKETIALANMVVNSTKFQTNTKLLAALVLVQSNGVSEQALSPLREKFFIAGLAADA